MSGLTDRERLSMLVHEVRSPVAALTAIRETVSDPRIDARSLRELVRLVLDACRAIGRLLTDAALESVHLERIDLGRLVRDAAEAAVLRGGQVRAVVADGLPAVDADPLRLRQALDNLLENAVAYSPSDATVVVRVGMGGGSLQLSVTDSGPGVPFDEQRRIFDKGVRLDVDRPGSGLGLAIARTIVEAHGGRLAVESVPGEGATFTLILPLAGQ